MMRLISRQQVENLLTYEDTIQILEKALGDIPTGRAITPPRVRMDIPQRGGRQVAMMGYVESCKGLGIKISTTFEIDPQYHNSSYAAIIVLHDMNKGGILAVMDASYITEVRTAAGSAVATRHLARKDSETLAIIGAGKQGRSHLKAISRVRPIKVVRVCDPSRESREKFLRLVEEEIPGAKTEAVGSPREAVEGADIVCTTSLSPIPVVELPWVKPGTHINAIGAWTPETREIDSATVAAAKVVLDSRAAVLPEAGDILIPIKEGIIAEDHIYAELGEICNGSKPGRTSPREITLFKSVGSAVTDVATAVVVYQRAVEQNVGNVVPDLL
jgi:ornithine cyclodeaminase/alanine dehydrogenase-like protein (mu-crystallin family)